MSHQLNTVRRTTAALALLCSCVYGFAQDGSVLTLDEALKLAKQNNGTVQSALNQVKSSQQNVVIAQAAYYPTITAQYQYNSDREQFVTTATETSFLQVEGSQSFLNTSWTLLDSGERDYSLRQATRARDSLRFNARQVLRTTLFNVVSQYYDALRAQELERVAQSEVTRTQTVLDQVQTRIKARDAAQIEELQANADFQNARVSALTAHNTSTNAAATLKGTIGYSAGANLPPLQKVTNEAPIAPSESLESLIAEALSKRPDLMSQRKNIESERFSKLLADREAGVTVNLSANYIEQVTPVALEDRTLTFLVNLPVFDGGKLRAQARQIEYNIRADQSTLGQAERVVRSDIEAAYSTFTTDSDRLNAAQIALDAAQKNYDAAVDSQKLGAYDLIQVITAQSSLVTAESNQIQALYDFRIADVNLKLVTGAPIPGE